jgi:hypothetical protein
MVFKNGGILNANERQRMNWQNTEAVDRLNYIWVTLETREG